MSEVTTGSETPVEKWLDVKWVLDPVDKSKVESTQVKENTSLALDELDTLWHGEKAGLATCRKALESQSRYVLRKTTPIQEVYTVGRQLGKPGTYGAVCEATLIDGAEVWAVKFINK